MEAHQNEEDHQMELAKSRAGEILSVAGAEPRDGSRSPEQRSRVHHDSQQEMEASSPWKQRDSRLAQLLREFRCLAIIVEDQALVNPILKQQSKHAQNI